MGGGGSEYSPIRLARFASLVSKSTLVSQSKSRSRRKAAVGATGSTYSTRWYVARVHEGREDSTSNTCKKLIDSDVLSDCFVPKTQLLKKYGGSWHATEPEALYPGYIFMASDNPKALGRAVDHMTTKVELIGGQGDSFIPLAEGEQDWFACALDVGHVLRPSVGRIDNGVTHVETGPLKGCENRIRKIDRHKRLAMVEVEMPDRNFQMKAALEITHKT